MNKILKGVTGVLLLSLIACGPGERRKAEKVNKSAFPIEYVSDKEAIKGGTLMKAIVSDNPFQGVLSIAHYQNGQDAYLLGPIAPALYWTDGDFNIIDGGMFSMKLDVDNKVINVKIREGLKWEDGAPLTVDDYIYTYEVISHKDYTGVRYSDGFRNVEGVEEFHKGEAKTISGLEKVSDTELKIHIKEVKPEILTGDGGLSSFLLPKHYLKDIAMKDLEKSEKLRVKPLSYGAYKISQIIPGESIEYVVNENYYDKEHMPKVEKLVYKILPSSSLVSAMKVGEYDEYKDVLADAYKEYKDFDNQAVLGRQALYYNYIGFNLGHWDNEKNINVPDPNKKMADIKLRQAMGYALDIDLIAKQFYGGLREKANSPIPPVFEKFHNSTPRYNYDVEKANALLDEAGYKDVDGDGIREDKEGKPFVIKFAFPSYDIAEPLSQQYIQNWAKVGLKVELATGRLMASNVFFDKVQSNDDEIDIYCAAWGVGSALDMSGLYGKTAKFNFARITDDKNEELLSKLSSLEAVKDLEFRKNAIREWEDYYMNNVLGFLPVLYKYELLPINKRIKEATYSYDSRKSADMVDALTQVEPISATEK